MARDLVFKRSTSQVSTLDTINKLISPLGPAITGIPTSSSLPAKLQNTIAIYQGETYVILASTLGNIEVWKYTESSNTWALSTSSIGPATIVLTVNTVVGVFSVGDYVSAGAATGQLIGVSGSTLTVKTISGTFPGSGALTDTTSAATANITSNSPGVQIPLGLNVVNDKLAAIWTETAGGNSVASGVVFDGATWSSRVNSGATILLDGNQGGASAVWRGAVWFSTKAGIGHFFPATGFGPLDPGSDSLPNPLVDDVCSQGSFSFWNGAFYFAKPDNGLGSGIRIFRLNDDWEAPAPAPPQWFAIATSGITTSGTMSVGADIGNYCLFVNKNNELCLLHSGQNSTRLAVTTTATYPAFTDITTDYLPSDIYLKTDVGVSFYADTRRRLNELHWLLIRDSAVSSDTVTLCSWDGQNPVEVLTVFTGSDLLISSGRDSEIRTYTGIQPGCYITDVNTTTPPAFPGRAVITYTVKDIFSRNVDVEGQFSIDGIQWFTMTEGAGDDGATGLSTSPTGDSHIFYWDAFADLDGSYDFMNMRIVPRIAVATNEVPPNRFVAIIEEGYLQPPVARDVSTHEIVFNGGTLTGSFVVGETITGGTSTTTGVVQYASSTNLVLTGVSGTGFQSGSPGELITGATSTATARVASVTTDIVTTTTLPADETTDLEQFHEAESTVTRGHAQFVFQGRLGTNQTRIRFIKLILRGSAISALAQVNVYVSGQGPNNQYTSGPYSSFQALSTADTEVIITGDDLLNQPSALGKRFMVVVEFDLDSSQSAVVSTPFYRYE